MAERLRIGVIGAGGVAQVEHIPNLLRLPDLYEVRAVAEPSAAIRAHLSDRYGLRTFPDFGAMLAEPLDAVLVASPDALHLDHVARALEAGLHVFCEKPLTYAASDIMALAALRDRAGRILQVGYMKRFDPSYEALLGLLPLQAGALRHIHVEVTDPDAAPFVRHHDWRPGGDLPAGAATSLGALQAEQVARAIPAGLDDLAFRGFCTAYASAIVHDVNAVHGMLDVLGIGDGTVVGAAFFAGGAGGHGAVALENGALWTMSHLTVPGLPHYSERITLTFEGSSLELEFPSPWLNHAPTRLTERRGHGHALETRDIRTSFAEAFVEELRGFHAAVTAGTPQRNTAEEAARDMRLLAALTVWQTAQPRQRQVMSR
ncbi:MAG: Gfo/Idh/MocA family oxidoreductase [Rhodobacteraceae bacterium]|nr:Gfo/Idh/MocA family oxidoreductase [Paracoccaceae bacterium]